jgi:hypothetical protein
LEKSFIQVNILKKVSALKKHIQCSSDLISLFRISLFENWSMGISYFSSFLFRSISLCFLSLGVRLKDNKKQWNLVGKFLNNKQQFVDDKPPFSDFIKIVHLRNDALHYTLEFKPPVGDLTPLYNSYRYENAELAVRTIESMIEHLCENSSVQLPRWLIKFRGTSGYWDDAFC